MKTLLSAIALAVALPAVAHASPGPAPAPAPAPAPKKKCCCADMEHPMSCCPEHGDHAGHDGQADPHAGHNMNH
jgi:hypothetical protein